MKGAMNQTASSVDKTRREFEKFESKMQDVNAMK
jgi:hypothetical protein